MADQAVLNGTPASQPQLQNPNPILNLNGFHWTTVDQKFREHREHLQQAPQLAEAAVSSRAPAAVVASPAAIVTAAVTPPPPAPLPATGALTGFFGNFQGTGFNTIWRPRNGASDGPPVAGVTADTAPGFPNDAVLELNVTKEILSFSGRLGPVPNRGSQDQPDITLEANPYVQRVQDLLNPTTGKADKKIPDDIHFEPGLWLRIPKSDKSPNQAATLCRMASIPHGTTINAQCLEPADSAATLGPPTKIPSVDITPFSITDPKARFPFPAQNLADSGTSRLPQILTLFNNNGIITQKMLSDPNVVLRNAIEGQKIIKTTTFTVSTSSSPIVGGGTSNIAFLAGTGASVQADGTFSAPAANAHAVTMTSTFWIETVQWTITVPAGKPFPLDVSPVAPTQKDNKNPAPVPTFTISGPKTALAAPKNITVTSTQIQSSQNVLLNFNGLSWPHVSVATLAQSDKIPVTISA